MLLPQPPAGVRQARQEAGAGGAGQQARIQVRALWLAERDQALLDSGPEAELPEELMSLTL